MTEKRFDAVEHGNHIIYRENGQNMWRNKVHVRLNELYDENQELKEVIDSRDNEISELGKQRNYLIDENKVLQLKIKRLEQVKPIKKYSEKHRSGGFKMNENKRYMNIAKDDSLIIQDNMLHCVFVDDEIVEVLNEKEAFMLHYEKRLSELQMEIAKLKGKTNVKVGNLQPMGDVK